MGHAGAQYNLGAMCENVQGVLQNFAEALQWFQSAAEQGDENALKASVRVLKKNKLYVCVCIYSYNGLEY